VTCRYERELVDAGDIDSEYDGSSVPGMEGGVRNALCGRATCKGWQMQSHREIEGLLRCKA
jgi:hypothetical protein